MDQFKAFEKARKILALTGHKIFDPNWKYFRLRPSIIAVRPDKPQRSVFILSVHKDKLVIGGMQVRNHDLRIISEFEETFGSLVKKKPTALSRFRDADWKQLRKAVTPEQRDEFDTMVNNARLS